MGSQWVRYDRANFTSLLHFPSWKLCLTLVGNNKPAFALFIKVCFLSVLSSIFWLDSVQSLKSCPTCCDPVDCSTPGSPVHHQLPEFTQTHVHWIGDTIQPSHPLLSPSPAFNLSQHQGLFKQVSSLHQVAEVLEFQLQHQSFQWVFRTDFL